MAIYTVICTVVRSCLCVCTVIVCGQWFVYGHCCQYTVVIQFLVAVPVRSLCAVSGLCTAIVVSVRF